MPRVLLRQSFTGSQTARNFHPAAGISAARPRESHGTMSAVSYELSSVTVARQYSSYCTIDTRLSRVDISGGAAGSVESDIFRSKRAYCQQHSAHSPQPAHVLRDGKPLAGQHEPRLHFLLSTPTVPPAEQAASAVARFCLLCLGNACGQLFCNSMLEVAQEAARSRIGHRRGDVVEQRDGGALKPG